MMPKTKSVKKGYGDSASNNFIALGSRKNSDANTINAASALDSAFSSVSSSSSTKLLAPSIGQSEQVKNGSKLQNSASTGNLGSLASNSNTYLDPKTVKEEIIKALEKDDSPEKLIKLIKLIIINLKTPSPSTNSSMNKQQTAQQQPDLNYLMALSYVAIKKPQILLKNPSLVDFLCTNLLFTSKQTQQDKASSNSNVLKSKLIRPVVSPQPGSFNIQPTICNILYSVYENESSWPEIFIKAYFDDSLSERAWVDNPSCKEFVQNTVTAFATKPLPFSADNNNANLTSLSSGSQNEVSSNPADIQCEQISLALIDTSGRKGLVTPRYSAVRNEIEVHLVDIIRNQLSSKHQQANSRILGQTNSILQSSSNTVDNRNFLKLLQSTCGFGEVRAIALSKLEGWLVNPKLTSYALDLLLSICVNCNQGDQADRDLIAQIIKFKPKIKQQQHYFDCIRELIKQNTNNFETLMQLTVLNELTFQQQYFMQHQSQQQQQVPPPRNQHNFNLLQNAFATDSLLASTTFAQIMQKILLQRNSDDYLRLLRSLLRDTIRNSRQDFDLLKFTSELVNDDIIKQSYGQSERSETIHTSTLLLNLAGGLADFSQIQIRERYVHGICDLVAVCILVAITPPIKEAYLKRQRDTKEILIKYYQTMAQIQSDTVTWLQATVISTYKINSTELIRCIFKVLFMVDKPEQTYTIDNWPSEQERGTIFRVVSEIPVLSETLHQVLIITKSLPDHMFMFMLRVEESLLKIAALVHNKDIYSLKLKNIDQFLELLFSICIYSYQNSPTFPLVITALYWRAWQILLIITAVDPKGFGLAAWEKYPTLRLLMEMVMTDDFNYPPQSSITNEMSVEQFRNFETQACIHENQEILEFENSFELKQGSKVIRNESNSKYIGQVMKLDLTGAPRRPTNETIVNIRKLNIEYKLGQLLCKSRQPDFLLKLIKQQNSELSLPWLSSLIESSSDCLEIMPIQCICEFVWNYLVNTVEELPLKKQINIEQLIQRLKIILTTENLNDPFNLQQIYDTFDYFLNKLCSEKFLTRNGALKILYKLFISTNSSSHIIGNQQQILSQQHINLNQLIAAIKELKTYNNHIKPLFLKYFRKALLVETNPEYLNIYMTFTLEESILSYKQNQSLQSQIRMDLDEQDPAKSPSISSSQLKSTFNDIAIDFSNFFFDRTFAYSSMKNFTSKSAILSLTNLFAKFAVIIMNLNEYSLNDQEITEKGTPDVNIQVILAKKQAFDRSSLDKNSYIVIELDQQLYLYLHEKIYNLVVYMLLLVVENFDGDDHTELSEEVTILFKKVFQENNLFKKESVNYLNCKFYDALNMNVIDKLLRSLPQITSNELAQFSKQTDSQIIDKSSIRFQTYELISFYVESLGEEANEQSLKPFFECLFNKYGVSLVSVYFILRSLDDLVKVGFSSETLEGLCTIYKVSLESVIDIIQSQIEEFSFEPFVTKPPGSQFLKFLTEQYSDNKTNEMVVDTESTQYVANAFLINSKKSISTEVIKRNNEADRVIDLVKQNEYSIACLENIQDQINKIKDAKKEMDAKNEMIVEAVISDSTMVGSPEFESLIQVVKSSNKQNLEKNMNSALNRMPSNNSRIVALVETILKYENNEIDEIIDDQTTHLKMSENSEDAFFQMNNRCVIDLLLDFFCHLDPHIVGKEIEMETRLLFEMRNHDDSKLNITQPFLLSLFIHQANWQKLHDCVQFLFNPLNTYSKNSSLNPTIVLDFLSSLIHIPELWKGTESKILQKSSEENIINLNEQQICQLLNYIIKELSLLCESNLNKLVKSYGTNEPDSLEYYMKKFDELTSLKFNLNKRVKLLKHFLINPKLNIDSLLQKIVEHLSSLNQSRFFTSSLKFSTVEAFNLRVKEKLFTRIENLFLYCIYLEENRIIYYVKNPHRSFSDLYFQIDIPTPLDVKAHNLLNCFGEIEANYVQNAASSGTIGISSIATTYRKKEKEEVVAFVKKHEAFMMDANLLCIKLASTHPFIFLRQIPMMEGLLQGRVVYSFDEFKRRKFDKLFHYIIDLLNILIPYVFHKEYSNYIESIIAHYFDVFRSYCSENREANGSLVQKFFDFFEKFINTDIQKNYNLTVKKYSAFIVYIFKLYPDIGSLKFINGILAIPFDSIKKINNDDNNNIELASLVQVNIFNQKSSASTWSMKQLEPFTSKLLNRNNYDGVLSVLNELDSVSQKQPIILSCFVFYLKPMMQDPNDFLRDSVISLIMRYLRLNPKESESFFHGFVECLTSTSSKIFESIMKVFPDFNILCSEKSNTLLKFALKGSAKHNIDISKQLTDAIRLLNLEKYAY